MRALAALIVVVLLMNLATLVALREPDSIEGFSLAAYQAHDVVDDSWDYKGEQSALEARKQTRRHEYVKARIERRKAELQRAQEAQEPSPQPHTHSAPQMSYTARVVAACESGRRRGGRPVIGTLSWTAENPRSTASGAHQFLDSTWRRLSASRGYARAKHAPPHVQIAAFNELYRKRGLRPWLASKSCWGPIL